MPPALAKIVSIFGMVPDSKLKYQQLLQYAKQLPPLPRDLHTEQHKVKGCVSQVWMVPTLRADGTIYWAADSDSALTKGLAALLVQGLSGATPEQIARMDPAWLSNLSPQLSLTPSRTNGFLNMFRTMQGKSLELLVSQGRQAPGESPTQPGVPSPVDANAPQPTESAPEAGPGPQSAAEPSSTPASISMASPVPQTPYPVSNGATSSSSGRGAPPPPPPLPRRPASADLRALASQTPHTLSSTSKPVSSRPAAGSSGVGPVQSAMRAKLSEALQPSRLVIEDESSQHAGHAGMAGHAGQGGESHFRVTVTSDAFEGTNTLKRHRLVYQVLKEEMAGQVHAMSLVCKTPAEDL